MDHSDYKVVTQAAWDRALEDYQRERRYHIPASLTFDQAKAQFAMISRVALLATISRYGNYIRQRQNLPPLRQLPPPQGLTQWVEAQIAALDERAGNPGSHHYHAIANNLLARLRNLEDHFLHL